MGLKLAFGPVAFLQHHISLGKSLLHIASFIDLHFSGTVSTLMNGRNARVKGFFFFYKKGKNLIPYLDRLDRIPCLVGSLGCHRSHLFPFVAAKGIEEFRLESP
jgi:hypothetical protein